MYIIFFIDIYLIIYLFLFYRYNFYIEDYLYYIFFLRKYNIKEVKKNKKIFFRLEKDNKLGPYKNKDISLKSTKNNPSPYVDFDKKFFIYMKYSGKLKKYLFGFESEYLLKKWFSEQTLKELYKKGYKIRKYESIEYFSTNKQSIFKKRIL
jgi:hypothetical protein